MKKGNQEIASAISTHFEGNIMTHIGRALLEQRADSDKRTLLRKQIAIAEANIVFANIHIAEWTKELEALEKKVHRQLALPL